MFSGRAVIAAVFSAAPRPGNGGQKTGAAKRFIFAAANVTGIF
jgi:hypothetical protein